MATTIALGDDIELRARKPSTEPSSGAGPTFQPRVHWQESAPQPKLWPQQAKRILEFQQRWEKIRTDLPPQLSRKHIGMISIGGVIGTGLFVGSADALRSGGPVGAFLGYLIVGSVVYSLCISVGEMIAYYPNVGGVVGLADLYVDKALGFSMGWAAWYNWSITLPTEITAAVVVLNYWEEQSRARVVAISALFLLVATTINCFPSRYYGEMEFYLSCVKVLTILVIIMLGILVDLGASSQGPLGFKYWIQHPFPDSYLGISGSKGQFLGFWAVIMQASFSFFGSEAAGIAAGEVIHATKNVPRALRKVWIRITLFYLSGVFISGLLVPLDNPGLKIADKTGRHSPFVIAFKLAGWKVLPDIVNGTILLSAWSAAASDIYMSSRFLFFLGRRKHAPSVFAHLFRYPRRARDEHLSLLRDTDEDGSDSEQSDAGSSSGRGYGSDHDLDGPREGESRQGEADAVGEQPQAEVEMHGESVVPRQKYAYVMPLTSILTSSCIGLLTFLSYKTGSSAETVFSWLVSVASVASLQSWAAMLFTYIRWHQGTVYYENTFKGRDDNEAQKAREEIKDIKANRQWGQPYLAWYAFGLCILVLFTNGWAVFVHNGWRIADTGDPSPQYGDDERLAEPVSLFLSAYVPIPFFLLLTFGYKLIKQTKMIRLEDMTFYRGRKRGEDSEEDAPNGYLERFLTWLLII
ncbi:amino acid permease-domain-containing protein [Earliella scabrosa]|nr:amino acid permease-domain-containing protein [Earliella scabrosa]